MLFNSISFAIFFIIVFFLYWYITKNNLRVQNILLLIASYVFYGWWDWRFLFLLISLSVLDYSIGNRIDRGITEKWRRTWLITGVIINLGILGVFKYYNFFINGFIDLLSAFGYNIPETSIKIVLPLGISFYVFLSLSYIIEIYRKTLYPNYNILEVLLSLGFFPIILAGPIQRPSLLLPQIAMKREFNYDEAIDALKQILWGLFTKVVIADNLSFFADKIFQNYSNYPGSTLLIGAVFYSLQIYADFSGYSNIAIGVAKLLGFNLMKNFAYPYFSRDITEFWKRWHISLTSWFRDYVFLPISFSVSWKLKSERIFLIKKDLFIYIVASSITWLLTGLWHGANYTFLVWGMIHGFFLIIYQWQRSPRKKILKKLGIENQNYLIVFIETLITIIIVLIAWIVFRSDNLGHAYKYISEIFSSSLFAKPDLIEFRMALFTIFLSIFFVIIEWKGRENNYAIASLNRKWSRIPRYAFYYFLILTILVLSGKEQQFIYFQF